MTQNCSFCLQPDIIYCMNRSVHHKHSQQEDRSSKIINELLLKEESANYLKYNEVVMKSDQREFMSYYIKGKQLTSEYLDLLQYYKFRFFVPVFAKATVTNRIMTYYYDKLKHYYNAIKKQLHMTVENSSTSILNTYISRTQTEGSNMEEVLKGLKRQIQQERKKTNSISNYKTESKALQELVSQLKLNPQFENIKTLKTQDCFGEQSIFQETTQKKHSLPPDHYYDSGKITLKSKLFKKVVERNIPQHHQIIAQHNQIREYPKSRSKSIKVIRFKDVKEKKDEKNEKCKLKLASQKVKGAASTKTLPGRNLSLEKIIQNHYSSPYQRKAISTQKNKITTTVLSKNRNSIQNLNVKHFQETKKSKDSILTTQLLKFQNSTPYRSTPSSPSGRKAPRPEIKVTKADNILTIRKKKLQALREKTSQK